MVYPYIVNLEGN